MEKAVDRAYIGGYTTANRSARSLRIREGVTVFARPVLLLSCSWAWRLLLEEQKKIGVSGMRGRLTVTGWAVSVGPDRRNHISSEAPFGTALSAGGGATGILAVHRGAWIRLWPWPCLVGSSQDRAMRHTSPTGLFPETSYIAPDLPGCIQGEHSSSCGPRTYPCSPEASSVANIPVLILAPAEGTCREMQWYSALRE